ncbi:MAG: family 10 glycosylhydrolase [Prevotellaceae bacterium]|jgi:hypothetical protein|nr:family 10 glycosylhydrolase [Prevotellaceae bacterium]
MNKKTFLVCVVSCIVFAACGGKDNGTDNGQTPNIPIDPNDTTTVGYKSVQLWIDAHANFSRFNNREAITYYMEKIKETGFNELYVDVKPGIGHALYDSDILPPLTRWGSEEVTRDWDYLTVMIEEAEKLDIQVIASISTLGFGYTHDRTGLIYDDPRWNGKTQMEMIGNNPNNIVDMRDQTGVDAVMLNPCLTEVQTFVISIVEEIVTKYPKLKGICLDYCRWYGGNYGFGDATISAFEAYSGEPVTNKNNIITATGGIGPQYNKWIEFRTQTITNLITNIRSAAKAIRPDIEFHLWASADWGSRYSVGQNWASKRYTPSGYVYTATYSQTGFADQMDVFSLGSYADHVWKSENPGSVYTVENFVTTYDRYTMGDCKVNGSIGSYAYRENRTTISDAVYLCLKNTDGLMVFDLSHVINFSQWDAIKTGIGRVIK